MEIKEQILELYFNKQLKQKEIATKLNISKYVVSRTLTKDCRYLLEKEKRKENNRIKHKEKTIQYINQNRNNKRNDYEYMRYQHIIASLELSGGRKNISNRAYRNWNTSAYKYNSKTKTYNLRKELNAGFATPKKIRWE